LGSSDARPPFKPNPNPTFPSPHPIPAAASTCVILPRAPGYSALSCSALRCHCCRSPGHPLRSSMVPAFTPLRPSPAPPCPPPPGPPLWPRRCRLTCPSVVVATMRRPLHRASFDRTAAAHGVDVSAPASVVDAGSAPASPPRHPLCCRRHQALRICSGLSTAPWLPSSLSQSPLPHCEYSLLGSISDFYLLCDDGSHNSFDVGNDRLRPR